MTVTTHGSNTLTKIIVVGLINNDYDAPYREQVQVQLTWCGDHHLIFDTKKTIEILMKFWKWRTRLQSLEK